jgi:hypothetical protein
MEREAFTFYLIIYIYIFGIEGDPLNPFLITETFLTNFDSLGMLII